MRWPLPPLAGVLALALLAVFVAMPERTAQANHNPAAPTNLQLVAATDTTIRVQWDAPSDTTNVSWYRMDIRTSPSGSWSNVFSKQATLPRTHTFTGLQSGTAYDARVRSCQDSGSSHCGQGAQITASTVGATIARVGEHAGNVLDEAEVKNNGISVSMTLTGTQVTCTGLDGCNTHLEVVTNPATQGLSIAVSNVATTTLVAVGIASSGDFNPSQDFTVALKLKASGHSGTTDITSNALSVTALNTPDSPTNLRFANTGSHNSVTFQWDEPDTSGGKAVTGYDYRFRVTDPNQGAGDNWTFRATSATSVNVTNLTPATEYDFSARAKNALSASAFAAVVTHTTADDPNATAPGRVTDLSVSLSGTAATLSWTVPSNGGGSFTQLNVSVDNGSDFFLPTADQVDNPSHTPGATQTKTLAGTYNSVTKFRIRYVNAAGTAEYSNVVMAGPDAPGNVRASALNNNNDGTDRLEWDAVTGATGYEARRRQAGQTNWEAAVATTGTGTQHDLAKGGGTSGSAYDYQVRAKNSAGPGPWSSTVSVAGRPGGITDLAATASTMAVAVTLSWTAPTTGGKALKAADGYVIEWRVDATGDWSANPQQGNTTAPGNASTFTVDAGHGLAPGTVYDFRIRADNPDRFSFFSNTAQADQATVNQGAAISATNPTTLKEGNLNGATLTVDLAGLTYESSIDANQFSVRRASDDAAIAGLSVALVTPVNNDTATLTLIYDWTDAAMTADTDIEVVVRAAAHSGGSDLVTGAVSVGHFTSTIASLPQTATVDEGDDGSVAITLTEPAPEALTIEWWTAPDTAAANVDYTNVPQASPNEVVIPAGSTTSVALPFSTTEDTLDEDDETFFVTARFKSGTLGNLAGKVQLDPVRSRTAVTITDDDDPPTLSITSPSVNEGDSGTTAMTFHLTLSEVSGREVRLEADRSSDRSTATLNDDYVTPIAQLLVFMPGETTKSFDVTVNGDTKVEGDETVVVLFDDPPSAVLDPALTTEVIQGLNFAVVTGTILNDDIAPTTINLSVSPDRIGEGSSNLGELVTVTASFPPGSDTLETATALTVSLGLGVNDATPGDDYTITGATSANTLDISIPAGQTSGTGNFTFTPVDDTAQEGDEFVSLTVATPPAGFTAVTPATLTLVDNDISARIAETNPSPLSERTLDGARLTVDLVATQYVSSLDTSDFALLPQAVGGLSVASVNRVSNTRAELTLSFSGNIVADVPLQVVVDGSAHTSSGSLTTAAVTVTPAPTPAQVTGVTAIGGPGSLTVTWSAVGHADGYRVSVKRSAQPSDVTIVDVTGGSTSRAGISGLLSDTEYDVRVRANSNFASNGNFSDAYRVTTLPGHAIVSSTDPSPLTENNLDGATLTVDLRDNVYDPWAPALDRATVTVSGVPGVSIADVTRVSDQRMVVTLAYDDTDFDTDALLRVDFYLAHTGIETISAVTPVKAVVEQPPGQVQNVRATAGTQQVHVQWDTLPSAYENLDLNVYKVQWKQSASTGGWRERRVRGSRTWLTIGARPGTEYTVRVIATRHKAQQDGPPSAEARATTPEFRYRLGGTEPARLTEANLRGAALLVDLEGARWNLGLPRYRFTVSGVPGVWVERVERVSDSRAKVILYYRGNDFDTEATLRLRIFADTYSWNEEINLTTKVYAVNEGLMNLRAVPGDGRIAVSWDRIDGASVYRLEWKGPGEGYSGNRAIVTPINWYTITRKLQDSLDGYTVRVRAFVRYKGWGRWEELTVPTTMQNQRASVTVAAANPVALTEGGAGATYLVVLDGQPTGNVVITPSSDNGDVTTQPSSLTFTRSNWHTPQTVSVRAAQDGDAADETATVSHTVSGADGYAGIDVASVSVAVSDDDTAGVTVTPTELSMNEGSSATYTVVLDTQPVGDVVISMFPNGVTTQPGSLTFTSGNWQTPQTVTVSAGQDDDTDDETAAVSHGILAGPDSGYSGVLVPYVVVDITDDDEPVTQPSQVEEPEPGSVTVSATSLPIREGGPAATYTVTLDVEPTENVTITVSSDHGDVTTQPSSLTFTTGNWQTAQTVSVSAGQDNDKADDAATISHSASGGNYDGVAVASVSVSVTDDDSDRAVLEAFYQATGGHSWTNIGNWGSDKPLNQWHGVTTNGSGQVTGLVLRNNGLSGSLPAELGKLETLQVLSLDRNSISGSLPTELGNLSNLTRLAMNRNSLSGAIPSQLGSLSNLSIIGLAWNQLSGSLPSSLGNLSGLTKVSLHDNTALSGALPSGFTNLGNLQRLAIANTGLCLPDTAAFDDWLAGVPDKPGIDGLTDCASP